MKYIIPILLLISNATYSQYDTVTGKYNMNSSFFKLKPMICIPANKRPDTSQISKIIAESIKTSPSLKRIGDSIGVVQKNTAGVEQLNSFSFRFSINDKADTLSFVRKTKHTADSLALSNLIPSKGSATFSGVTLQTAYIVTHGLSFTPSKIFIQPTSANAAVLSWISAKTSTTFTVNFISVPVVGTNNITFDWEAFK